MSSLTPEDLTLITVAAENVGAQVWVDDTGQPHILREIASIDDPGTAIGQIWVRWNPLVSDKDAHLLAQLAVAADCRGRRVNIAQLHRLGSMSIDTPADMRRFLTTLFASL